MKAIIRRFLTRNAVNRGFLGGSQGWMAIGVMVFGARLFNRFVANESKVLLSKKLERGQTLVISYPGSEAEVLRVKDRATGPRWRREGPSSQPSARGRGRRPDAGAGVARSLAGEP